MWTLVFLLFFVIVYGPTIMVEEIHLEAIFGDEFLRYREAVPRLIPRPGRTLGGEARAVAEEAVGEAALGEEKTPARDGAISDREEGAMARYLRNREWQVALGAAGIFAVLGLKVALGGSD